MNRTGITLIIIGMLLTGFTGFGFFTEKKAVDVGRLELTTPEPQTVKWTPYLGVGIILLGGLLFLTGIRKMS